MNQPPLYDVFISHASEDKADFVAPLAGELKRSGAKVWYDEYEIQLGDSIRTEIARGLAQSLMAVVVLSPFFFKKPWAVRELNGIVAKANSGEMRLLPVFHGITVDEIRELDASLADIRAANSQTGVAMVAKEIFNQIKRLNSTKSTAPADGSVRADRLPPGLLSARDILDLLSKNHDDSDYENLFELDKFDKGRFGYRSYSTRIGGFEDKRGRWQIIEQELVLRPGSVLNVISRESISLPSWIEAELSPAASLARLGLIVSAGPIVDPLYQGRIGASIFNATDHAISLSTDTPFLEVRFRSIADRN
jgi:deoxycytidine triphosphate deaminase